LFIGFGFFFFLFISVDALYERHEHLGDMPSDVVEVFELFLGDASQFQQHIQHGSHLAGSSFSR